jgi:hypothetical protein
MMYSYRIFFKAKDVECEIVVTAKGYTEAREAFFLMIKEKNMNNLYMKSVDQKELKEAEDYISEARVRREDIIRMKKTEKDDWL